MPACSVTDIEARGGDTHKAWCDCQHGGTDYYASCVRDFCANPMGCSDPNSGRRFPFDVNPGLASPPWTDLGAGTRGLPKADAGVLLTAGQVLNYDPAEFNPLNLWRLLWTNPAKYAIALAKMQVIPLLGQVYAAIVGNPLGLTQFALAQCAIENKDPVQYVLRPALVGAPDQIGFVARTIGPAVSQQWAIVAGIVAQKAAQDAIKTGDAAKTDQYTQVFIQFFADNGENIGNIVQSVLNSVSSLAQDSTVWNRLAVIFSTLSRQTKLAKEARDVCGLLAMVFTVIGDITQGIAMNTPPAEIADKAAGDVLGIRPSEIGRALAQGASAVQATIAASKTGSIEGSVAAFSAITGSIGQLASTLSSLSAWVGGGLEKLIDAFTSTVALFENVQQQGVSALLAAQRTLTDKGRGGIKLTGRTPAPARPPPPPFTPRQPSVNTTTPKKGKPMSGTSLLLGAGAGFLFGGPAGAAVGAAIGAALGQKQAQGPVSGFGAIMVRPIGAESPGGGNFVSRDPFTGRTARIAGTSPSTGLPVPVKVSTTRIASVIPVRPAKAGFAPDAPLAFPGEVSSGSGLSTGTTKTPPRLFVVPGTGPVKTLPGDSGTPAPVPVGRPPVIAVELPPAPPVPQVSIVATPGGGSQANWTMPVSPSGGGGGGGGGGWDWTADADVQQFQPDADESGVDVSEGVPTPVVMAQPKKTNPLGLAAAAFFVVKFLF